MFQGVHCVVLVKRVPLAWPCVAIPFTFAQAGVVAAESEVCAVSLRVPLQLPVTLTPFT